ncbi:putative triacylglycerol lipase [Dioscorea sansibarensis]
MAVVGVPPVGCVPSQRTIEGGIERHCVPLYNQAAVMFNLKLSTELERLNKTLTGAQVVYIDIYTPLLDLIMRPFAYGFEESTKGCCGTGYFEVTLACNSLTTPTCEDASKYVFWDSYHPTERAYNILITEVFQKYGSLLT